LLEARRFETEKKMNFFLLQGLRPPMDKIEKNYSIYENTVYYFQLEQIITGLSLS